MDRFIITDGYVLDITLRACLLARDDGTRYNFETTEMRILLVLQ